MKVREFIREINNGLKSKGSFVRGLSQLTVGSLIAYFIGFFFTPIITRIYSPSDYGAFAFFNSVFSVLLLCCSMGYSEALIIVQNQRKLNTLVKFLVVATVSIGAFVGLILFIFWDGFISFFNVQSLGSNILLLPILLVLGMLSVVADAQNVRDKLFKQNGISKVISISSSKAFVSVYGFVIGPNPLGLIIGEIINRLLLLITLLGNNTKRFFKGLIENWKYNEIREVVISYKNYPLYVFPNSLLTQITSHIPILLISKFYSERELGFYVLAISLLSIPVQVIGFSMGKVFLQKTNDLFNNGNHTTKLISISIKFYYSVLLIASLGYGIVFVWGEDIFRIIAGSEWQKSGLIASFFAFTLIFQLVSTVMSPLFRVYKKERLKLAIDIVNSLILASAVSIGLFFEIQFDLFYKLLAIVLCFNHIILISFVLKLIKSNLIKHIIAGSMLATLILTLLLSLKEFITLLLPGNLL
ncbi:MAG: oligosaccharide flippase family protein [Fulvivirga sp.]|uniref:oligosaccharide flippase family protein n=1 Tax=Fulvivirga sp. TaxID=1931237 RepID=UPI0032EC456A